MDNSTDKFNKLIGINIANPTILTFYLDRKEIGKLVIQDNKLEFVGDVHISATILFNKILKPVIDDYIKEKLELIN